MPCERCKDSQHVSEKCFKPNLKVRNEDGSTEGCIWPDLPTDAERYAREVKLKAKLKKNTKGKGHITYEKDHNLEDINPANPANRSTGSTASAPTSVTTVDNPEVSIDEKLPVGSGEQPEFTLRDPSIPADGNEPYEKSTLFIDMRNKFMPDSKSSDGTTSIGEHPLRPGFGHSQERKVRTNHFRVTLPRNLYRYTIGIPQDNTLSRPKRRELVEAFIDQNDDLKRQRENYATDNLSTIISWKELEFDTVPASGDAGEPLLVKQSAVPFGTTKDPATGQRRLKNETVSLYYHGRIDMLSFEKHVQGSKGSDIVRLDTSEVERAVNLLISEATSRITGKHRSFKVGANKFFNKDQYSQLDERFVCHHGFFTTVKAAMGGALLNVNTATSAFFKPMTVREFLQLSSARPQRETNRILKGVRVWIDYERGDAKVDDGSGKGMMIGNPLNTPQRRTRTITQIGVRNLEKTTFWKGDKEISVHSHLTTTYPQLKEKIDPDSLCVNLGSAKRGEEAWFAPETLMILPYQPYREKLSQTQTTEMLKLACRKPQENVDRIMRAGLLTMGFGINSDSAVYSGSGLALTSRQIMSVPARCIEDTATQLQYGNKQLAAVQQGGWRIGDKFYNTDNQFIARDIWYLYKSEDLGNHTIQEFHSEFTRRFQELGIKLGRNSMIAKELQDYDADSITTALRMEKDRNGEDDRPSLVVFISGHKDAYPHFKREADRNLGAHSVCMLASNVRRSWEKKNHFQGYLTNVAVKLNLKLGNVNHIIAGETGRANDTNVNKMRLMIMGADVTHPTVASPDGMPSIAAVVGSVDKEFGKFLGSMRWQKPDPKETKNGGGSDEDQKPDTSSSEKESATNEENPEKKEDETSEEKTKRSSKKSKEVSPSCQCTENQKINTESYQIITAMEDMAFERIKAYWKANKKSLPTSILYYRDGVSSSQYGDIKSKEVQAIRGAFEKAKEKLKIKGSDKDIKLQITAVIVSKRHHTRFYPESNAKEKIEKMEKNGNVLPGTVVDSGVTSPYYFDFLLVSHAGIKGTSKPAHYFVLENEMKFTAEELQNLVSPFHWGLRPPYPKFKQSNVDTNFGKTQKICCLYPRADKVVSYASPAYYADRLCERGRVYLEDWFNGTDERIHEVGFDKDKLIKEIDKDWEQGKSPWASALNNGMFWM